jgi:rhodanese-related sulfurtransferase
MALVDPRAQVLAAVILVGFLAAGAACAQQQEEPRKLTLDELKALLAKDPKPFFLDVRQPRELEELGTIRGYVNIPLDKLEERIAEIPKDTPIVVACNLAIRAARGAATLQKHGYKQLSLCALREWKEKGYDLIYSKVSADGEQKPAQEKKQESNP